VTSQSKFSVFGQEIVERAEEYFRSNNAIPLNRIPKYPPICFKGTSTSISITLNQEKKREISLLICGEASLVWANANMVRKILGHRINNQAPKDKISGRENITWVPNL